MWIKICKWKCFLKGKKQTAIQRTGCLVTPVFSKYEEVSSNLVTAGALNSNYVKSKFLIAIRNSVWVGNFSNQLEKKNFIWMELKNEFWKIR